MRGMYASNVNKECFVRREGRGQLRVTSRTGGVGGGEA